MQSNGTKNRTERRGEREGGCREEGGADGVALAVASCTPLRVASRAPGSGFTHSRPAVYSTRTCRFDLPRPDTPYLVS